MPYYYNFEGLNDEFIEKCVQKDVEFRSEAERPKHILKKKAVI